MSIAHQYGLIRHAEPAGKRLVRAAKQAAAIAKGEAEPARVTKIRVTENQGISVTGRRGRPKAETKLSAAEKQRAYRARKKGKA